MSGRMRVAILAVMLALVLALGVFLLQADPGSSSGSGAHEVAERRLDAVKAAGAATIRGTHHLTPGSPESLQGDRSASGPVVTYALLLRRRLDFSEVPMDDARGGPVEPLLRLAKAQESALAKAGFCPMVAKWSTRGDEGRTRVSDPESPTPGSVGRMPGGGPYRPNVYVQYRHQSESGGGGGRTQIDLNDPQVVHHRIYAVPKSGATLFVRSTYDQASMIVEVELSYSDRTLFDVEYPTGSHIVGRQPGHYSVHEALVDPK